MPDPGHPHLPHPDLPGTGYSDRSRCPCRCCHENWIYNITERGTLNFSVEKGPFNKFMKTLLWTLAGRHRAVAEFQNGTLDVRDQGDRHSVSLTTRNRLTSG